MGVRISLGLIALLCLALAIACVRIALAATISAAAQDTMVRAEAGRDVDAAALQRAAQSVARAREWWDSVELDELEARIALRQALVSTVPAQRIEALRRARDSAQRATLRRPTWPYAAAQYATVLHASGDHGTQFAHAVETAARTGPNEMRVMRMLARLWLDPAARDSAAGNPLARAFDAQLRADPPSWIDRADRAGSADVACDRARAVAAAMARCLALGWNDGS